MFPPSGPFSRKIPIETGLGKYSGHCSIRGSRSNRQEEFVASKSRESYLPNMSAAPEFFSPLAVQAEVIY
jgi:hypothetical protein